MIPTGSSLLLLLMASSSSNLLVWGQDDFQCGVDAENSAQELPVSGFAAINLGPSCKYNEKYLVPKTVNWHVYALSDDEKPKYSMYPSDLVKPQLSGGTLEFTYQDILQGSYQNGETIKAGVNLYIPISQMKRISIFSVDQNVEVIADNSIFNGTSLIVQDSGVDNKVYVNSPFSSVQYRATGVDSVASVNVASGSSVALSGVDNSLEIKTAGNDLTVDISGVNQHVLIEGDYSRVRMSGVDSNVRINGESRCDHISSSGVDNNCSPSEATVTVPELDCLSTTWVTNNYCNCFFGMSIAAATGTGIAILVALIASIVGCCVCCARRRRNRGAPQAPAPPTTAEVATPTDTPAPPKVAFATTYPPTKPNIVEAEVLEIKDGNDFVEKEEEGMQDVDINNSPAGQQGDIEENKADVISAKAY